MSRNEDHRGLVGVWGLILSAALLVVFSAPAGARPILPVATYPAGTQAFGPLMLPATVHDLAFEVDVSAHTDPAADLVVSVDLSRDGGTTWQFWKGVSRRGGIKRHPDTGLPVPLMTSRHWLPPGPTWVRGTVTVTHPLQFALDLETAQNDADPRLRPTVAAPDEHRSLSFDTSTNGGNNNNVTSISWSHTTAATAKALAVFGFVADGTDGSRDISNVTYAAVAITSLIVDIDNSVGNIEMEVWYQLSPTTGAQTVAITGNGGAGSADELTGVAVTLIDDVGAPTLDTSGSGTGNADTGSQSLTIADNAFMVAGIITDLANPLNLSVTVGTERQELDVGGQTVGGATRGPLTPAGAYAITWGISGNAEFAIGALSFAPAVAGGAAVPLRTLMGVGQ